MRVAYLTDKFSIGGGGEYIRRQMAAHAQDEGRMLGADRDECTAAAVNAWRPDLIQVNHLRALCQLYRNPLCRPKARTTFVVHGVHLRKYDFLPRTMMNRIKRWLRLNLERWLYSQVDELVALNADDVKMLRAVYRVRKTIRLEPNTVEPVAPDPRSPEYDFIMVARFDFQKGYDILLAAIAEAQNVLRAMKKRALFIGGGETLGAMKAFAAEKGISDLVEFAGEISNAAEHMWRGRVLVAPSRWEGSPYAVLEAVARGKKVIASDCPGNRDIVRDGENGWLFRVGDVKALAELLVKA